MSDTTNVHPEQFHNLVHSNSPSATAKTQASNTLVHAYANIATAARMPTTVAKSDMPSVSDAPLSLDEELVLFELEAVDVALAELPVALAVAPLEAATKMSDEAYVLQLLVAAAVGVYGTVLIAPSDSAGCEYE